MNFIDGRGHYPADGCRLQARGAKSPCRNGNGVVRWVAWSVVAVSAVACPSHTLATTFHALAPGGAVGDDRMSIVYDTSTGEVAVDAPAGKYLSAIRIDSATGIFTADPAVNLGPYPDTDWTIFYATFGGSFGSRSFGTVAQPGLSSDFIVADLTVAGTFFNGGAFSSESLGKPGFDGVDLVYVAEPSATVLIVLAFGLCFWHGRDRSDRRSATRASS